MNNLWVNDLINQTIEKGWCTGFFCTTCGARDLKGNLRRYLDRALGKVRFGFPLSFTTDDADVILEQLENLNKTDFSENYDAEFIIMSLLYISWQTSPCDGTTARMSKKLDGTYAGEILSKMINLTKKSMTNEDYKTLVSANSSMVSGIPNTATTMANQMNINSGNQPGLDISNLDFVKKAKTVLDASNKVNKNVLN